MKGQLVTSDLWLVTWVPDGQGAGRGLGASPVQFPQISAVQSSQKLTDTQLAVHDFLHQDHPTYSNDLTPSDYDLFWNLKSDNDGVRYPWWWTTQAFLLTLEIGSI